MIKFTELNNEYDIALRKIFKKEIKENFLIKIFHGVIDTLNDDITKYYNYGFSLENAITGNLNLINFDICKIIIGLHKSNTVFLSNDEKAKKQNDESYQESLIKDTIENIRLRKYGSSFFRQKPLTSGDRFLYFRLPYYLFVLCTKMNEILIENSHKAIPFFNHLSKISDIGLATLTLIENNFMENAYPLCRTLIELYIEMLAINDNKHSYECYKNFQEIEFQKVQCGINYPQSFIDIYRFRKNKKENNKNNFLHFGWVDYIENYHNVVTEKPYTTAGLFKYLNYFYPEHNFLKCEKLYKQCHSYSHANIMKVRYPLLSYFELTNMLYLVIPFSYKLLCGYLKLDTKINNIDLIDKTSCYFELFKAQYKNISTEKFEEYYN